MNHNPSLVAAYNKFLTWRMTDLSSSTVGEVNFG